MKVFLILITLFLVSAAPANAAIISLNQNGEIVWNVLAAQDDISANRESLQIKKIANTNSPSQNQIKLNKDNGKIELSVISSEGEQIADVSNIKEEIIEIQEQKSPSKLKISINDSSEFEIVQSGIKATTTFPITINPQNKEFSLSTSTGIKFLAVLPLEAFLNATKANSINEIDPAQASMQITEGDNNDLQYQIPGIRNIALFNVFSFQIPVNVNVSASSGKILLVDQPLWLALLNPFLS